MKRQGLLLGVVAIAILGLALLRSGFVYAAAPYLQLINDFDVTSFDEEVAIMNPQGSNSCALIYVFDNTQTLQDCCGCLLSGNDLLDLSVEYDLLLSPEPAERGIIEILPSQQTPSGKCDPITTPVGTGNLLQATEYQLSSPGLFNENLTVSSLGPQQSGKTFFANVSVGTTDVSKVDKLCATATSCYCGLIKEHE